jgi:hypothetical protein
MQERHVKKRDNWPNFTKFLMAFVQREKSLIGSRHSTGNRFTLVVARTDFQNFGAMEGH